MFLFKMCRISIVYRKLPCKGNLTKIFEAIFTCNNDAYQAVFDNIGLSIVIQEEKDMLSTTTLGK